MYNLTNVTDTANTMYDVVKGMNDLSGGLLFACVMLLAFMTFVIVNKKESFRTVLIAASFFTVILAVFGFAMKLIGQNYLIVTVVIFFASIIIFLFVEER